MTALLPAGLVQRLTRRLTEAEAAALETYAGEARNENEYVRRVSAWLVARFPGEARVAALRRTEAKR